jgi:hypothetical protein
MITINYYESSEGKHEVLETYNSGTDDLKAGFEVAIKFLRVRNRQDWRRPNAHKMSKSKEFRDFFEIRFKANNVQQRPIGYFGPGESDFTILIWAIEKGNKLLPEEWDKKANRFRKEIIEGTANAKPLKLEGDPEC